MKTLSRISAFLPLAITLIWLQFLPDRVPLHYDFSGRIDRWGSKWENLLLPGIVLVMGLVFYLVERFGLRAAKADEKRRAHAEANAKVLWIVMLASSFMFSVLQCALLYGAAKSAAGMLVQTDLPLNRVTVSCLCLMLIVLGNFMPRSRMNSAVGFRCGWTMYNDVTWQRSNRFAGYAIMLEGLVTGLLCLFLPDTWAVPVFLLALIPTLVVSLIYARRVYMEEKAKE